MTTQQPSRFIARLSDESGISLIETVVACGILIVVIASTLGAQLLATSMTENNGHLGARTAEYAVDKMEQLLELTYGDAQSNRTVFPSINNGGVGLAVGGSSNPDAPVVGYSDYLDQAGNILCSVATPCTATPPTDWYYKRVWSVTVPSSNLKLITVVATISYGLGNAQKSVSTIAAYKTNCPTGC
jgi:type II secretory pathway pseudopilin PulG